MARFVAFALTFCFLAVGLAAPAESNHEHPGRRVSGEFNVYLNITLEEPSGILVYHVTHPTDLRFWGNMTRAAMWYNPAPLLLAFVYPNGTVHAYDKGDDREFSDFGQGEGVAYAGIPSTTVRVNNPNNDSMGRGESMVADSFGATEGWLVFLWAKQPEYWTFDMQWDEGTTIEQVASGPARYYTMRDFRGGVRAGVGPVGFANVADTLSIDDEGGDLFGSFLVQRTGRAGVGNLTLRSGDFRHDYDMTGYPTTVVDPSIPRVGACPCWTTTRWLLATDDAVDLHLTQAGDKLSYVYPLVGWLPAGTLPFAWSMQDESPEPPS